MEGQNSGAKRKSGRASIFFSYSPLCDWTVRQLTRDSEGNTTVCTSATVGLVSLENSRLSQSQGPVAGTWIHGQRVVLR